MQQKLSYYFDRDTFLHLRLPFSFFLLPVFCFAISQLTVVNWYNTLIVFISLHFFIYPGSNSYNSYMDKDEGSIGGLKNPPPVTKKLFYASVVLDLLGLGLCLLVNPVLALLMLIYIGISKAYSWKKIRLKKYGVLGWIVVAFFQGGYTFLLVNMPSSDEFSFAWFNEKNGLCMLIASLLIGASYPLTQVYQHEEDSRRGDLTISYKLGIRGTFIFTGLLFIASCLFTWSYFGNFYTVEHFFVFIACLSPVVFYYLLWLNKAWNEEAFANYEHAMRMITLSSSCMILCFLVLFFFNRG
jgi:1,4-dihydroxy-2-naphthoate octaprenyltransferase